MAQNNRSEKLELILGNSNKNVEQLFNDIKELYTLSQCSNIEGPTITHTEEAIMKKYTMSENILEKNLRLYSIWDKKQPKLSKNHSLNFSESLTHDGLEIYL